MLAKLGKTLEVDESTGSKRLKVLRIIQKQEHWISYDFNGRKENVFSPHRD